MRSTLAFILALATIALTTGTARAQQIPPPPPTPPGGWAMETISIQGWESINYIQVSAGTLPYGAISADKIAIHTGESVTFTVTGYDPGGARLTGINLDRAGVGHFSLAKSSHIYDGVTTPNDGSLTFGATSYRSATHTITFTKAGVYNFQGAVANMYHGWYGPRYSAPITITVTDPPPPPPPPAPPPPPTPPGGWATETIAIGGWETISYIYIQASTLPYGVITANKTTIQEGESVTFTVTGYDPTNSNKLNGINLARHGGGFFSMAKPSHTFDGVTTPNDGYLTFAPTTQYTATHTITFTKAGVYNFQGAACNTQLGWYVPRYSAPITITVVKPPPTVAAITTDLHDIDPVTGLPRGLTTYTSGTNIPDLIKKLLGVDPSTPDNDPRLQNARSDNYKYDDNSQLIQSPERTYKLDAEGNIEGREQQ